jgi:hypothetical protein
VRARGRACDVCATTRSSQQLRGHDRNRNGAGPRSSSAVLCGPIMLRLSGLVCVCFLRAQRPGPQPCGGSDASGNAGWV